MGGCEFKSAFIRVLNEREFIIVEISSFGFAAHNIERNSPASGALAESALFFIRRILSNQVDAGNITIAVSEDIL